MKQLIIKDSSRVTLGSLIPKELEKKFFGVETSGGGRGFVTRSAYGGGPYRIATCNQLSVGNGLWFTSDADTLTGFLTDIIKADGLMVFVFDDFLELAKWLVGVDKG